MIRKIIFLILLLIFGKLLFAQNKEEIIDTRPLNNINLNLLGDASLFSINYERQSIIRPTFIISSKLGLGYNEEFEICILSPCSSQIEKYLTIPHHITGNVGKGRHFFEFGLGGTIIMGKTSQSYLLYPMVGYRFLPLRTNNLNFRIFGQIPLSGIETDDIIYIPFGLNLGVSF